MAQTDTSSAALPPHTPPTPQSGQVREGMAFREGDGPEISIPPGPCELIITEADVTITWERDGVRGAAAIPLADYHRRIEEGVLVVD